MLERKIMSRQNVLLATGAILGMLALAPYASANTIRINFSGNAGSGYADLTVTTDPNANPLYKPEYAGPASPGKRSAYDPEGAKHITDASGRFGGIAITGVWATNASTPPNGETLPQSFSWLATGTSAPSSYDNLFYPNGSPLVCPPIPPSPYTFSGGFLDIYGVMFTLGNGNLVSLWSDGVVPPGFAGTAGGLTYGLSVFTPTGSGGYVKGSTQFAGVTASVPTPHFMWLFGVVLIGLFAWRRSAKSRNKLPLQAAA